MKPTKGLAQGLFRTPWPIMAAVVIVIGISRWAGGQEWIEFQDPNNAINASVLSVINTERTRQGLGAVSEDELLQNAAQWMADDMAAHHTLDHTDSQHRRLAMPSTREANTIGCWISALRSLPLRFEARAHL